MSHQYKPENYNSVSPYFVIEDPDRLIDMLQQVFLASQMRRYERPDGSVMHVEVKLDDSIIMIGGAGEEYKPNQLLIHVYVPNVDSVFQKAMAYGCESLEEPVRKENDPDKRGMFRDFAGNVWAVATQAENT